MSQKDILSVRNLIKTYPNGVQALKGVSFDVREGEFLVIIGLSGSGKSTLLRCLNRLHDPTSGSVIFEGNVDIAKVQGSAVRDIRRQIGMIFQHFNLVPRFTVIKNVLLGRLAYTPMWKSILGMFSQSDHQKALDHLELVGIAEKAHLRADNLSGGQQQRVAIARVLSQNPKIILADEPVASLDPATCHTVMEYLKKVNEELGITIVCNLHFLSLVRQYATRVIALKGGEVIYEGSPKEIDDQWFERIYGEGAKEVHIN
jgi:phosphonate transport system ATP-binding protein